MTAGRASDAVRWAACFTLVLCFHIAGGAALLARWNDDADAVANAPVIMIELSPVTAAPQTEQTDLPPGPQQSEVQPEPAPQPEQQPEEKPEIEAAPAKKAELSITPPPKPPKEPEKKPQQKHASLASAPSPAEQKAPRAAAPRAGANSHNPNAVPNWKSALVAQLERSKRYPSDGRGASGVAQLAFNVDRSGAVHNAHIVRSSGSSALDSATLNLISRAAPLPPPPPEIHGAQIPIVVPIRYSAR